MDSHKSNKTNNSHRVYQVLCQVALVTMVILGSGCSKRYSDLPAYWPVPFREYDNQSVGRFKTSYLVDQIDGYYRGSNPGRIGVTTLVNLDDLYTTSSFGRMYSEQLMSELAMRGYDVVELRHADALQFLADRGELALSREAGMVRRSRDLSGVIVGTYVVSPVRVYVNARLIDPASSMILSAGSVEMEKTKEIGKMLRVGGFPASLERIPVKHLTYGEVPDYGQRRENWRYDSEESAGGIYSSSPLRAAKNDGVEPQFHDKALPPPPPPPAPAAQHEETKRDEHAAAPKAEEHAAAEHAGEVAGS